MELNSKALGKRLKQYRKKRGISQMALAEAIDCSPNLVSYYETGRRCMSLKHLVAAANVLHITADELLIDHLEYAVKLTSSQYADIISDCTDSERKILLAITSATKTALRTYVAQRHDGDHYTRR